MSDKIITLSASSIGDLDCHHKFDLHRVQGIWSGTPSYSSAQLWGIGCHEILRNLYDPSKGTPPHLDKMDEFVRFAFLALDYPDQESRQEAINKTRKVICNYLAQDEDAEHTIEVEKHESFTVKFDGVTFNVSARLDRLLVREHHTLTIREYKTGKSPMTLNSCWVNLVAAKKMYPGFQNYVIEIDSLVEEGPIKRVTYHSRDFKGYIQSVAQKVRAFYDDAEKVPTPCASCHFCSERPTCIGQQAVDGEDLDF